MLKIKLLILLTVFGVVGLVMISSPQIPVHAEDDPLVAEIGTYKTWNKITAEPIRIGMDSAALG